MKKILGTLFAGIIFFITLIIISQDATPNSQLYNFKRIYEKVVMSTKTDPNEKATYYSELLAKRVQELEHVRKVNHFYILSASLRYSTTAGEAVAYITTNNLTHQVPKLRQQFETYKPRIAALERNYTGDKNHLLFIQDAVNYTEIYLTSLNDYCTENPSCQK